MGEKAKRRGLEDAAKRVVDLAGNNHGLVRGDIHLNHFGGIEALVFDGRETSVMLTEDHTTAKLPQREISVQAWVRIDKGTKWGGIIGAMHDNGDDEKGWILGYNDSKFYFAINTENGKDKLTYLESTTAHQAEKWFHVTGTYDGIVQRIYVEW
jgi:hypothetical protein